MAARSPQARRNPQQSYTSSGVPSSEISHPGKRKVGITPTPQPEQYGGRTGRQDASYAPRLNVSRVDRNPAHMAQQGGQQSKLKKNLTPQQAKHSMARAPEPTKPKQQPVKDQDAQKKRLAYTQEWLRLALKILGIIIVALILFNFIFGFVRLNDHAMQPAVKAGDLVIFYRLDKDYLPGDLCVIKRNGRQEVLRVLARSGDKVDINEQGVIVNGSVISEPDIKGITRQFEEGIAFPVTLQEGEIFILGDNRPRATDSRIFGPVKEKDTLGTVMLVIRRRDF